MTLTFRDGTHNVKIYRDGKKFDRENLSYFFNSISEVTAKLAAGNIATVKVTLTPSYEDGLKILASGLLGLYAAKLGQNPAPAGEGSAGKTVSSKSTASKVSLPPAGKTQRQPLLAPNTSFLAVQFLYNDQEDNDGSLAQTPWFTGVMTTPNVEVSSGGISITINAMGSGALLGTIQGVYTFENESALSVLNKLAKSIGIKIAFEKGDTETESLLTNKKITGGFNEPKLQSIKSVLHAADCFWTETTGTDAKPEAQIVVKSRKKFAEGQIEFTFVKFRQIDPSNNVIPIYDFSLGTTSNLFLAGAAFGSFQRCFNEKTKKVDTLDVSTKDIDGKSFSGSETTGGTLPSSTVQYGKGAIGVTDPSDAEVTGSSHMAVVRDDVKNTDEIKSTTKRAVFLGPTYTLVVPGLPKLRPLSMVQVIVGDKIPGLSGVCLVSSVLHKSDGGGWKSEIQLRQTGGLTDASLASQFSNKEIKDVSVAGSSNSIESSPIIA